MFGGSEGCSGPEGKSQLRVKLQVVGNILGSPYIEIDIAKATGSERSQRVVFSGNLDVPNPLLLIAPKFLYRTVSSTE